jgi:hypothetical protein
MPGEALLPHASLQVPNADPVDTLLVRPPHARALYVLAHGAGAPMRHAFMEAIAHDLAARGVATLRYNFPYAQRGRRAPDRPVVLEGTVRAAIAHAHSQHPDLPLFAGGKSMGGRMTSQALAAEPDVQVRGIVFLGFPLHGAGKPPDTKRAEHLARVNAPMLFVQGTRDSLARLDLITSVVAELGELAELHVVDDGDHGFHVRKSSGRDDAGARAEIADALVAWMERQIEAQATAAKPR